MQYINALLYSGWRLFYADFLKGKLCFLSLYILEYRFLEKYIISCTNIFIVLYIVLYIYI